MRKTKPETLIRSAFLILTGIWSVCSSGYSQSGLLINENRPKIVNIINFIRLLEPRDRRITEDVLYQTVVKQIELMRKYELGGTFLLQYDALIDPRYQKLLQSLPHDSFEIGAWWEIPKPMALMAKYSGAVTGTRLTTRPESTPTCLTRMP